MNVVRKIVVLMAFAMLAAGCWTAVATAAVAVEGGAYVGVGFDHMLTESLTLSPCSLYSTPISDDAEGLSGIDDESAFDPSVALSY